MTRCGHAVTLVACLMVAARASALELIIPWPEGGETDALMRPIAPFLAKQLAEKVTPTNLPGNFGVTGVLEAAKRPADGSTVVSVHEYLFSVMRSGKLATDPLAGLKPVCGIVYVPSILGISRAALGNKDPKDWLNKSKKMTASWTLGPTSTNFMMLALLDKATGLNLNFKPFSSKSAAVSALLDGEVDLAEINPEVLLDPANKSIVAVAISSPQRDPRLPNLPTFKEQGINVDDSVHRGLAAPQGTPAGRMTRLEKACQAAAADPELDQQLAKLGARSLFMPAADYAKYLAGKRANYKSAIGPAN
jgi:tripartite-type tricarboxylate transporter receptor subunit TctC